MISHNHIAELVSKLSPGQRELFQLRLNNLQKIKATAPRLPVIARSAETDSFPLSFAQERLWFLDQLKPGNPAYNLPGAARLRGQVDLKALKQSVNEIIRRHETLRTRIITVEGRPVQVIASSLTIDLPVLSLKHIPEDERERALMEHIREEAQRPFDLAAGPLLRTGLLELREQEYVWLLTIHHIISDHWSLGVFVREAATLYEAFSEKRESPLAELKLQYADFACWQRQWLTGETLEKQLAYWTRQLAGFTPSLELPIDHPRPPVQTFRGSYLPFRVSKEVTVALKKLSQQQGATLFMTLLAAFKALLSRYTGQEDVIVGSGVSNRKWLEVEPLIGFFVNTLILRTDLSGNPTFKELIRRVREVTLGAYANQDAPLEKLLVQSQPARQASRWPAVQVAFTLQNSPVPPIELAGLSLTPMEIDTGTAKFEIEVSLVESPQGIAGRMEYNADLFEVPTISRMAGHFESLLLDVAARPNARLSEFDMLTVSQKTEQAFKESQRHQINRSMLKQTKRRALNLSHNDL